MNVISTRNKNIQCSSLEALKHGLASDGGLYIPPTLPKLELKQCLNLNFEDLSFLILSQFFDEFDPETLKNCIHTAYDKTFDHPEITPLVKAGRPFVCELFHGPSAAFKDIALQLLPQLLKSLKKIEKDTSITSILTATSGDTGSAALLGFKDVENFTVTVFYPHKGISKIQRKQMTTQSAANVKVYGIHGNFDDAQKALKEVFKHASDYPFVLSSANSINIGRFQPQVTYYFKAYADLVKQKVICIGDPITFSVPTGNFGNILAAYVAKEMGLPIQHLLCASNENDVLVQFIKTGTYDRNRPFHITSSPSMDILISSNLERLLFWLTQGNTQQVASWMNDLEVKGSYTLDSVTLNKLQQVFIPYRIDESEGQKTIQQVYQDHHYLCDPHTAIAYAASQHYHKQNPDAIVVVCATASPYKFPQTVLSALNQTISEDDFINIDTLYKVTGIQCPPFLKDLKEQQEIHTQILDPKDIHSILIKDRKHD